MFELFETAKNVRALVFMILFMVILASITTTKVNKDDINITGNLVIQTIWPSNIPSDVDTWVKSPGDDPVGFTRKVGKTLSLMKDDLGITSNDLSGINYELVVSQAVVPGDYHVNLVLYSLRQYQGVIPVTVVLSYRHNGVLFNKKFEVNLDVNHQHVTVVNFFIDKNLNLLTDTINNKPYQMWE